MRFIFAGLLNLTLAVTAFGQAVGDVESIGFGRAYRPDAWTPMLVRLTPTTSSPFRGKIQVIQEDLDKDRVLFSRVIDLRGNADSGAEKTQRYWMYFIPQPRLYESATDLNELKKHKLQVFLCTESGKQLVQLPINDPIKDLEHQGTHSTRSSKLVLYVTDQSAPIFTPYVNDLGVKEDVEAVQIPIGSVRSLLPENVLGYQAVDAIVWCDADPGQLTAEQRSALEEWIRRGGKLVVCQTGRPGAWDVIRREFATMLPVTVTGIEQAADIVAMKRIVSDRVAKALPEFVADPPKWPHLKGPYPIARAAPKAGAVVAEVFDTSRKKESDPYADDTPWLVRWCYGSGQVTWVAQDLGDVSVIGSGRDSDRQEEYKWTYLWDRILDWPNDSQPPGAENSAYRAKYSDRPNEFHLGDSFSKAMDFADKGVGYLGLAMLFFVVYWALAGPGSYFYLASHKKAGYSWFVFALVALGATGLTILIVKLLIRGAPEVHHATFVRSTPDEPAIVYSEIGLYIPRDGEQKVEIRNTVPGSASYVTAFPESDATGGGFNDPADYEVNVSDPKAVSFRYRSTLKKLQARWVGRTQAVIGGSAQLLPNLKIAGVVANSTGRDLHNVCIAFHYPSDNAGNRGDWLLYVPLLKKDDPALDLGAAFNKAPFIDSAAARVPGGDYVIRGKIGLPGGRPEDVESYWYNTIKRSTGAAIDTRDFPMLCLFDRLPAMMNDGGDHTRYDLHRPMLRSLDASSALSAGKLIVMAQTDPGPLPIPIEVNGDPLQGTGITYFEAILSLDATAVARPPSTRPATGPATQSASAPSPLNAIHQGPQ